MHNVLMCGARLGIKSDTGSFAKLQVYVYQKQILSVQKKLILIRVTNYLIMLQCPFIMLLVPLNHVLFNRQPEYLLLELTGRLMKLN